MHHLRPPALFLLCLALIAGCSGGGESEAARETFDQYARALRAQDGETAASLVTQSSHDYYQSLLDKSLDLDEAKTRALPLVDKVTVIMVRHLIPADQARSMNGRDLIAHAVNEGWIDEAGVQAYLDGKVTLEFKQVYDEVWGDFVQPGSGAKAEQMLRFVNESGQWKLDLLHMIMKVGPELRCAITRTEMTEDQFVMYVAGSKTGKPVPDSVWQPLGR